MLGYEKRVSQIVFLLCSTGIEVCCQLPGYRCFSVSRLRVDLYIYTMHVYHSVDRSEGIAILVLRTVRTSTEVEQSSIYRSTYSYILYVLRSTARVRY